MYTITRVTCITEEVFYWIALFMSHLTRVIRAKSSTIWPREVPGIVIQKISFMFTSVLPFFLDQSRIRKPSVKSVCVIWQVWFVLSHQQFGQAPLSQISCCSNVWTLILYYVFAKTLTDSNFSSCAHKHELTFSQYIYDILLQDVLDFRVMKPHFTARKIRKTCKTYIIFVQKLTLFFPVNIFFVFDIQDKHDVKWKRIM